MQGTCPALRRSRTVVRRGSGTGHVTPQLDKKTAKKQASLYDAVAGSKQAGPKEARFERAQPHLIPITQ